MKSLKSYIQEKLIIKKNKNTSYKYFPQTKEELKDIIRQRIKDEGNEVDLNDVDVSKIIDMSYLFEGTDFNGYISSWDVSNVKDMTCMFCGCKSFNQDISNWDVSNVKYMGSIFYMCNSFNQDISNWDVSKVKDMNRAFCTCKTFNQDISNWDVSNVTNMYGMFYKCEQFNQDISNWDVYKVNNIYRIFDYCPIEEKYKPKFR